MSKRNSQAAEDGGPRAAARRTRAAGQAGQGQAAGHRRRLHRRRAGDSRRHRLRRHAGQQARLLGGRPRTTSWSSRPTPRHERHDRGHRQGDAKNTLKVYEDPRCPVCAQFEQTVGPTVEKDVKDGKYKIEYVGATFLDGNLSGEGSKNALSALGAALNVSPEAFLEYKKALYSEEVPPRGDHRHVQGRLVPDQDREHRPGAQEQQGLPEGRQGRHVRPLGAGDVEEVRRQQGRRRRAPRPSSWTARS